MRFISGLKRVTLSVYARNKGPPGFIVAIETFTHFPVRVPKPCLTDVLTRGPLDQGEDSISE